jgi:putative DNA primase/helicase
MHGLKDASTDATVIRRWWQMWPDANIAVCTGAVSGVVVLDNDIYKSGDTSLRDLEQTYYPLPATVQQLTGGGGEQSFFAHPGTPIKNGAESLGPGLDVRGDGGYVVVPPSLHASGRRYVWEINHHPDDRPLAPLPPWLLALCQETRRPAPISTDEPIPQGRRNATLFRIGCGLRARGLSEAAILGALAAINATQCHPPLAEADVGRLAASCARYAPGSVPWAAPTPTTDYVDPWLGPRSKWCGVPLAVRRIVK